MWQELDRLTELYSPASVQFNFMNAVLGIEGGC